MLCRVEVYGSISFIYIRLDLNTVKPGILVHELHLLNVKTAEIHTKCWLHKVKRIYYVKNIYVRQITLEFSFCLLLVVNVCDSMSCYVPQ